MNRLKKQLSQILTWKEKINLYELLPYVDFNLSKILKFLKKIDYRKSLKIHKDKAHIIKQIDIEKISCSNCNGRGYVFDKFFEKIYKQYKEICKNRPVNLPEFDQGSILEEDVIKRVEFIYERGDLLDNDILVIGDDDLISIALGLTKLPQKIYVIEADDRLVNYIKENAKKFNLSIEVIKYDVRNSLPENLLNKFDIFITDPSETLTALETFLLRGMQCLKTQGAGYFGLTTIESSLDKWFELEKFIIEKGFVITDIKRKFSVYPFSKEDEKWPYFKDKIKIFKSIGGPKIKNWYYSSFIRIEKMKNIKIKNESYKIISKNFYLDKETLVTPVI